MAKESVLVEGEEIRAIRTAARETNTIVSIGISEKVRYSSATLFNSNVLIGTQGEILNHHRKLVPTFFEKLTWSPGDGHGLAVSDTSFGKIGNLICGENTNPLARYALMAQGEQIHISSWPPIWPTRASNPQLKRGTNRTSEDESGVPERWSLSAVARGTNYDNVAANRIRLAAHCFEAKCYGISCSAYIDSETIENIASDASNSTLIKAVLEGSQRAATMFLDPSGRLLPSFTISKSMGTEEQTEFLQNEEGILYADMDLDDCIEGKQYHDVVGGYQRLDIFDLKVNRSRRAPATFTGGEHVPEDFGGQI